MPSGLSTTWRILRNALPELELRHDSHWYAYLELSTSHQMKRALHLQRPHDTPYDDKDNHALLCDLLYEHDEELANMPMGDARNRKAVAVAAIQHALHGHLAIATQAVHGGRVGGRLRLYNTSLTTSSPSWTWLLSLGRPFTPQELTCNTEVMYAPKAPHVTCLARSGCRCGGGAPPRPTLLADPVYRRATYCPPREVCQCGPTQPSATKRLHTGVAKAVDQLL